MILEVAVLNVLPRSTKSFEAAFDQAKAIVSSMPGFLGLELHNCIEEPNRYILLVRWRTIEDHTEGFRKSAEYQRWRELLHHFYDPFPRVDHYQLITTA